MGCELAWGRPPTPGERKKFGEYIKRFKLALSATDVAPDKLDLETWSSFAHVLISSTEFVYVDWAVIPIRRGLPAHLSGFRSLDSHGTVFVPWAARDQRGTRAYGRKALPCHGAICSSERDVNHTGKRRGHFVFLERSEISNKEGGR